MFPDEFKFVYVPVKIFICFFFQILIIKYVDQTFSFLIETDASDEDLVACLEMYEDSARGNGAILTY